MQNNQNNTLSLPFAQDFHRLNKLKKTLYNGMLFSHSTESVIENLKAIGVSYRDIVFEPPFIKSQIMVRFKISPDRSDKINQVVDLLSGSYNWRSVDILNRKGKSVKNESDWISLKQNIWLVFEPMFNAEIGECPSFMFHLTTEDKFENILKVGLVPMTRDSRIPFSRKIYLTDRIDELLELSSSFVNYKLKPVKNEGGDYNEFRTNFVILKIKTNPKPSLRFFRDPEFERGIYTLEPISPEIISQHQKILLNSSGEIISKQKI